MKTVRQNRSKTAQVTSEHKHMQTTDLQIRSKTSEKYKSFPLFIFFFKKNRYFVLIKCISFSLFTTICVLTHVFVNIITHLKDAFMSFISDLHETDQMFDANDV